MIQSDCYASFQDILAEYKKSALWDDLRESSKAAYRKPLERLVELSSQVNSAYTMGFAKQMPVAVARSRTLDRDEWKHAIKSLPLSNNEKNKLFIVLNQVYVGAGLPKMELKPLEHEKVKHVPYSADEVEAYWNAKQTDRQRVATAFLRVGFWTGMRPWCESLPMRKTQIDGDLIHVVGGKRREAGAISRSLTVLDQAREALDFILSMKPAPGLTDYLWITETGRALTKGSVALRLEEVSKAAGVPYRRIYDARSGLITSMLRDGYDLLTVAKQAGHKSLETTREYDRMTREENAHLFKGLRGSNGTQIQRQAEEVGQASHGREAGA